VSAGSRAARVHGDKLQAGGAAAAEGAGARGRRRCASVGHAGVGLGLLCLHGSAPLRRRRLRARRRRFDHRHLLLRVLWVLRVRGHGKAPRRAAHLEIEVCPVGSEGRV
jgi:hypothetical protein